MWNNHQPASLWRERRANEEDSAGTSWKLTPGLAPPLYQQRVLSELFLKKPGHPSVELCAHVGLILWCWWAVRLRREQWGFGEPWQRWAGWRWQPWAVSPRCWNPSGLCQHGPAAWLPAPGPAPGMLPVSHCIPSKSGKTGQAAVGRELVCAWVLFVFVRCRWHLLW